MKKFFLFLLLIPAMLVQAQTQISIAQFIQNADPNTTYRLRGVVSNITNTTFGNFDLTDETGKILVYGLRTATGATKQFSTLGIEEGDTLTLDGNYKLYGTTHEVDPAQYVSHVKPSVAWVPVPVSISDFIALNDGKRYILTGVVTNIANAQKGNFTIQDNTGSIYVYGLANFSTYGIEEGDTVTINGVYTLYGSTDEVTGAQYISHKKPAAAWVPVPKTISEFIALNDGKRYILRGVVSDITETTYGHFTLTDETAEIIVWGISQKEDGNAFSFSASDITEGDTLSITGIYQLYGTTHEVTGAQYISHVHPTPDVPQDDDNVDFATTIAAGGWNALIGRTVTFSNDFYYCDTWNNTIAPHRLLDPEEYGNEGTADYTAAVAANRRDSCHLENYTISWQTYRTGTIIRGLKAYIPAANCLQAVEAPQLINNELPIARPDLGNANVVICAANVENFYVANASDQEALLVQKEKISKALFNMNADIYALCEVEQGTSASQALCDDLNELFGVANLFTFTNGGSTTYNSGAVTFLYRTDKIELVGNYIYPYPNYQAMKWRMGIQCFKHKPSGEKFNISMNHFWAKISKTDADRVDNMTKLITYLSTAASKDPDILVVGDLNAYTMEESNQMLISQKNYVDLLMKYAVGGYSHLYGCTAGYLDHAYCSPSMESQVTMAVPYHLNADTPKSKYGYAQGNNSMYRYSDHDPILVGLKLGNGASELLNIVSEDVQAQKILRNGQIVIIRSGVEYTITGQRVY